LTKTPGSFDPKRKIAFGVSKSGCFWKGCLGGSAEWKSVNWPDILYNRVLWPVKILEIAQTAKPPTLLPKALLFDFHWYDFYIKSLNIRII
jgi:hypothetical protein